MPIFAYIMAYCQQIQERNKKLTEKQSIEIALDANGGYEKVDKEKAGREGCDIKEKCDSGLTKAVQDTGKCA